VTTNQSVFAATAIAIALLVGALIPGSNLRNADRAGDSIKSLPSSISEQALFARNLVQVEQLNRLFPLPLTSIDETKQRISDRLHASFPVQDPVEGKALSAGRTVVSLVIDAEDLNDQTLGLIPNNIEKGLAWERPGLLSIYRDQQLVLQVRAGVRIHGGFPGDINPSSFRLYFREAYGASNEKMATVIPGAPGPLRRLIINKTDPAFRNAIAFDISRRIGGIAPHTAVSTFYLNGVPQGTRLLIEHLSIDFLESRFGHRDFTFLRMKGGTRAGHGSRWQTLTERFGRQKQLQMTDAETAIDMENLMRQYAAFLICGTGDAFQGGIVKDDRKPTNHWFFVNWDMEDSFRAEITPDYFEHLGYGPPAPPVLRPELWRKLRKDPAFQIRFSELVTNLLDTELTPQWLDTTIAHYRREAIAHGIIGQDDLGQVEQFFRNQPNILRKLMAEFSVSEAT
jgi:hypothetical protein